MPAAVARRRRTKGDHLLQTGATYTLHNHRDGTSHRCRSSNPNTEINALTAYGASIPTVGLRVRSATARYHWVMVVTGP